MGNEDVKSTIDTDIVNDTVIDILMEDKNFCAGVISQDQQINWVSAEDIIIDGKISQTQSAVLDVNCVMRTEKQAEIQQVLANVLAQHAVAQKKGFLPSYGNTESEIRTNILNKLRTNVTQSNVQEAVSNIVQKQKFLLTTLQGIEIGDNAVIEQSMDARATLKSILESKGYASVINSVNNEVQNTAEATADTKLNLFGGIGLMVIVLIAIIFLVGAKSIVGIILIVISIGIIIGGGVWLGISESKKNKK